MTSDAFRSRYGPAALVTGASSGIGRAFAEQLAALKFDLVLVARRVDRLNELAARLQQAHGVQTSVLELDLAHASAPLAVLDATAEQDVGLVVSNAGFPMKGAHETLDARALTQMVMVNCHAPLQLTRGFIPRLKARGKGGIILTSSIEGFMGVPFSAAYAASKALVNSLGEALWAELKPDGIDVLALCPGATDTEAPLKAGIDPKTLQNVQSPEEVARLALDNIQNGPTYVPSAHYKAQFDQLLAMPRPQALTIMAGALRKP